MKFLLKPTALVVIALIGTGIFLLFFFGIPKHIFQQGRISHISDTQEIKEITDQLLKLDERAGDDKIIRSEDSRFPTVLKDLGAVYVVRDKNRLQAEFYGGFDHYGLRLRRDGLESPWKLYYYTEHSEKLLGGY